MTKLSSCQLLKEVSEFFFNYPRKQYFLDLDCLEWFFITELFFFEIKTGTVRVIILWWQVGLLIFSPRGDALKGAATAIIKNASKTMIRWFNTQRRNPLTGLPCLSIIFTVSFEDVLFNVFMTFPSIAFAWFDQFSVLLLVSVFFNDHSEKIPHSNWQGKWINVIFRFCKILNNRKLKTCSKIWSPIPRIWRT